MSQLGNNPIFLEQGKEKATMKEIIITTAIALMSVFAPTKAVVLVTLLLVFVDMLTGIIASKHLKKRITSVGFKRTVTKLLMYEITVLLAFLVEVHLTAGLIPMLNIVASVIGLTEFKSIVENLDTINGGSFSRNVINILNERMSYSHKEAPPKDGPESPDA